MLRPSPVLRGHLRDVEPDLPYEVLPPAPSLKACLASTTIVLSFDDTCHVHRGRVSIYIACVMLSVGRMRTSRSSHMQKNVVM